MATYYAASWGLYIKPDPEVNSYTRIDGWSETWRITETISDGVFKSGEEVTISYAGDDGPPAPPITREIVGFYDNGLLVKDPSDTYALYIRSLLSPLLFLWTQTKLNFK